MIQKIFLLILATIFLCPTFSYAGDKAEIMLLPTRVVMEKDAKSAIVQLKNTGGATGQFSVSLVDMEMKEDGSVVTLDESAPGPYSAIPYLHISPKSITIRPGESQTVRILQKRNVTLEPGEYRSHLRVKMENDNVEGTEAAAKDQSKTEAVIAVKANLVLIIPVIFRVGETDYSVTLESPVLKRDASGHPSVDMYIAREGNRSVMGDFSIKYKPAGGGEEKLLTFFPGVPVYRPTARRFISVPLDVPAGLSLNSGSLEISYAAQETEGGKVLAQKSLPLP